MNAQQMVSRGAGRPAQVVTIGLQATAAEAARRMRQEHIGCLVVTDAEGGLAGIVTERDIIRRVVGECADPAGKRVEEIMTREVTSCPPDAPVRKVQELMAARHIRHLPVLKNGVVLGMISSREMMAYQHAKDEGTRDVTIFALAKLAESRDPETGQHLERVRGYAYFLAKELAKEGKLAGRIDASFIRLIYLTSPLHDVGKVAIPDHVLLKPGRLDDREFAIMKTHATLGAETLDSARARYPEAEFLHVARDIAASHHERVDGTGYPQGLAGEEVPLCARIFSLADVYDALVSKRVYKEAFARDVARGIIMEGKGTQFDAEVVEAFLRCERAFWEIRERYDEAKAAA